MRPIFGPLRMGSMGSRMKSSSVCRRAARRDCRRREASPQLKNSVFYPSNTAGAFRRRRFVRASRWAA